MTTTLRPGRWVLTDEQAAAVAAIVDGGTPADLDTLSPAVALEDGQLPASFTTAARLLSSATRMILVTVARPGSGSVLTVTVLSQHPEGPFSLRGGAGDGAIQLELLPTDTTLLVTLDQVLDLTTFAETEIGREPVELSANAWTGLHAAADSLREAALTADIARSGPLTNVEVTAEAIRTQLDRGLRSTDDRWVVTAGALVAPPPLDPASFDAAAAVDELRSAGLIEGRPAMFSTEGSRLAQTLGQLVAIGSVSLNHVAGDQRVPVGQLTTIVSPTDRLIGVWRSAADGLRVRLYRSNRGLALRLLRDLITAPIDADDPDLAVALGRDEAGSSPASESADPEAAALHQPGSEPWAADHTAPAGGLRTWVRPDHASDVAADLPAGAGLQVVETRSDWARIRTETGLVAWADARRLVPVDNAR